jgi:two-component system, LytTR family, response regulator LytT
MKVLVVGDERRIIRKLERVLRSMDDSIRIIGTVSSIIASVNWLTQHGVPDIILVHKEMISDGKPFQAEPAAVKATIIFTLQSDQFAFQAFNSTNLEYLYPAVSINKFQRHTSIPVTATSVLAEPQNGTLLYRNRFLVKQGQKFASVEIPAIAYFFSEGRFIFFKTCDNQKYLVEYTLEELEVMLNPQDFFRINRSLLISFKSVAQIHPYFGNRLKLYLDPSMEKEIIVSREKVNDFKTWLGQ